MLDGKSSSNAKSPRILRFKEEVKINQKEAVSKFWKQIKKTGTPIFEEIEGDDKYNIITFVVKGDEEIKNIVCFDMFVTNDIKEGLLERIEDTDVYFISHKILKGIRRYLPSRIKRSLY